MLTSNVIKSLSEHCNVSSNVFLLTSKFVRLFSLQDNSVKPVYTEEELAEIEAQQEADEESQYDIDYDEYEDYYKDDETK